MRFVIAAIAGAFVGMCTALRLFPSSDGIANSYAPIFIGIATLAVAFVTLLAGLVGRRMAVSIKNHERLAWIGLMCCVACGPVALALTPPWVAHRIVHNERLAAQRFTSLKAAVERTFTQDAGPARICDGRILMRHYSGPPFSDEDWQRITGNYVKQHGYVFMVYCSEKGGYGYTIDAWPARGKADGTRRFCTDESGRIGCAMEWNRSRKACIPCSK